MQPARITGARGLTRAELDAVAELERRVVRADGGRLKLEWDVLRGRPAGEVNDLLARLGGTLVGFCGIYDFGGEPELAGAVDPDLRRRGIGSTLLARALELVARRGPARALLVTPTATGAGRGFALAMGATLHHSEHHLVLDGPPGGPPGPRPATAGLRIRAARGDGAERDAVVPILEAAFGADAADAGRAGPGELVLVAERDGDVVGTLRLDLAREGGEPAAVYGLAVRPDVRGQGIGRAFLYEACLVARRRGARSVTLEVETQNDRALGLYTSIGFERRATEDYFALAAPRERRAPPGAQAASSAARS